MTEAQYQLMPPLSDAEFAALKASIAEHGIQVPVEMDEQGNVLDGHHRLRARDELLDEGVVVSEFPGITRAGLSEEEKRAHVRMLNLQRRHLNQEQKRGLIQDQVRETPERSDRQIAEALGVSNSTVSGVRQEMIARGDVCDSHTSTDTLGRQQPRRRTSVLWKNRADLGRAVSGLFGLQQDLWPEGLVYAREMNGLHQNGLRAQRAAEIVAEPPPLPTGPFRVIVADPPWNYSNRADDATHRARNPYPDMSIEDICALPVGDLAADDAVLWLWTTNAHMFQAFSVLAAWGFEQKTILTWVKDRMGTGHWLRGQSEHCLLAVRGYPTVLLMNQTTVLHGPLREHSRKPDEFYALVEALCPGSKVELFARQVRDGWVAHGNDIPA